MIRLYEKLSEYEVVMSMTADNEYQMVLIQFEKGLTRIRYACTYETACDPIRWQDMLLSRLSEFMFIYERDCKNKNELVD